MREGTFDTKRETVIRYTNRRKRRLVEGDNKCVRRRQEGIRRINKRDIKILKRIFQELVNKWSGNN